MCQETVDICKTNAEKKGNEEKATTRETKLCGNVNLMRSKCKQSEAEITVVRVKSNST